ncbi:MAG: response regulator [Deltaproteobacteria bacterium]|nr:response regulator [Deltaproteobacteria bacterium]
MAEQAHAADDRERAPHGDRAPGARIDPAIEAGFHEELRRRNLRVLFWSACVFNPTYLAWSFFDYLLAPAHWATFLALRLAVIGLGTALLVLVHRERFQRYTWEVFWIWLWICGAFIAPMLPRSGESFTAYIFGFILILYGSGLLPFWRPSWALSNVLAIIAVVPVCFWLWPSDVPGRDLIAATFFVITGSGASVLMAYFKYDLARSDYLSRTELARTSSNLESALGRLKEVDRMKSDFMANISHEMRTPLTLMLGALESLGSSPEAGSGGRQLEYLEVIRRNGLSLMRLINDLLDLARVEAAQARLRLEEFDLTELIHGITVQAGPMFSWRSLDLETHMPDHPVRVTLDRLRVEKVVLNLLSNAIKFTPAHGRIRVSLAEAPEHVEIEVADSGIGIAPEHHARIFERFSQVDATATRSKGGTGIGLALVREFVELHGGAVAVESVPGEGSTFTVRLPRGPQGIPDDRIDRRVARSDTGLARREEDVGLGAWVQTISESAEYRYGELYDVADRRTTARLEVGPRHGTVLVVEDSRDLARFIALQLASEYHVITAADGEEGWERARSDLPDLVITDLMMPRRDGYWLCEQLRRDPRTRPIPIIMLTARGQAEDRVEARRHGADVYLSKPFNVRELLAAIARLLKRKEERVDSLATETSTSMRVLTAGLAHELLNPLGFISNAVFALDELIADMMRTGDTGKLGPVCLELLGSANVGLERIQTLIKELKSVSEPHPNLAPERTDLNQSLRSTLLLAGAGNATKVQFHVDLCADATVVCRAGRINQVFLNLLKNALFALPEGRGSIWVTTRHVGDDLEIVIADDGCGIAPDNIERVFDPFFTTREPGRGTGLGLALCRRIVEEHGGTLTLTSVVGEGTRATVRLPVTSSSTGVGAGRGMRPLRASAWRQLTADRH